MRPAARRALLGAAAVLLLGGALLWRAATRQREYTTTWFDLLDTVSVVRGYASSQEEWDAQMEALHADLLHYHQLFDIYHHYDGMTNLYDVNAGAAAAPVAVSPELYAFLEWCAGRVWEQTGGATNVAAGALLSLWHDARESDAPAPPDPDLLEAARDHIDIADLQLDSAEQTVFFADPDLRLDVGAVAKGYAVELAAQAAEERGLESALLNIGGNLRAIGEKANGEGAWNIGVENPWGSEPAYIQTLALPAGYSLVVSGDYQRYFEYEGVRYAHLIDLTTGYPARYYSSVAILAPRGEGGMADAWSTALFCLPENTGRALLPAGDVAALWMYPDGSTAATGNWPGQPAA